MKLYGIDIGDECFEFTDRIDRERMVAIIGRTYQTAHCKAGYDGTNPEYTPKQIPVSLYVRDIERCVFPEDIEGDKDKEPPADRPITKL